MRRARGASVGLMLLAALVFAAGCGAGASSPSASPASPAPASGYPARKLEVQSPPAGTQMVNDERAHPAMRELDLGERELETAAGDCATACRALASMERATSQLCSIAELPDDRRRCDDARRRLLAARDRVRGTCSACAGGPNLDHDAPAPTSIPRPRE